MDGSTFFRAKTCLSGRRQPQKIHNKMIHKHTKTALLAALLFLLAGTTSQAQFFFLWKGDFRLGLTAGLNHHFSAFDVAAPPTLGIIKDPSPALLQPEVGLFFGMEKEINRSWAFGFDTRLNLHKNASSVTVRQLATAKDYELDLSNTALKATEGIYFAYSLSREMQFTFGAGLTIDAYFGGSATAEPAEGAPECQFGDMDAFNFGFGFAGAFTAGVTYYLNDTFFIKGDLAFRTAPFFSTAKMDEDFWGSSNPWRDGDKVQVSAPGSANLALLATIGFKW